MARVPYSPIQDAGPQLVPQPGITTQASPAEFGGLVGAATEKLGAAGQDLGNVISASALKFKQMANATAQLQATTAASKELGDADAQFRQLSGNNAVTALPAYQQKVQDIQDKYAKMFTGGAQVGFLQDYKSYADRSLFNAGIYVGDQAKQAHVNALKSSISEEQANIVRYTHNGQTPDFSVLTDKTLMLAGEMGLDKDSAHVLLQQSAGQAMHDVVVSRIASGDTQGAKQIFNQALGQTVPGTDLPLLDARNQADLAGTIANREYTDAIRAENAQMRADRLADQAAAQTRVSVSHLYDNASAMVMAGHEAQSFPTDAQIDSAYPRNPDLADEQKQRVHDLQRVSGFLGVLPGATPDQVDSLKRQAAPDPNDQTDFARKARISNALDTALNIRAKAISTDAAGYVLGTHSDIAAQFQAGQKDPQAFQQYGQSVLGIQSQMGVPATEQHVLPVVQSQGLAQDIQSSAENAPQKLQQLQQQYGALWPNVWRDLTTSGKLPAAYQSVGALENPHDAALLARAVNEQAKSGKTWGDLLSDKDTNAIKTTVRANTSIQQFSSSLAQSGASAAQIDGIMQSVDTLAFAKQFYDHDPNPAQSAIASFTSKYEFMPNGGARVPTENFDAVNQNAAAVLNNLDLNKIAVPPLYGQPGQPAPNEYLDILKGAPSWITSPKADALWLMDPAGRLVRDKGGAPLSVPFNAPPPIGAAGIGIDAGISPVPGL